MPENISLTKVTSEKVVPADTFNVFKNKLTQMVAEHKACLRRMREQERADNEEFFALAMYQQTGELPSADNTTNYPPVMHDGINFMQIPAGASAAKFGRHLGCAMYGKNEDCQLQSLIIGAQRQRKDIRTQVPEDERAKFELVLHRKYTSSQRRLTKMLGGPPTKWDSISSCDIIKTTQMLIDLE